MGFFTLTSFAIGIVAMLLFVWTLNNAKKTYLRITCFTGVLGWVAAVLMDEGILAQIIMAVACPFIGHCINCFESKIKITDIRGAAKAWENNVKENGIGDFWEALR